MLKRALHNNWLRGTLIVGVAFSLFAPQFGLAQSFPEFFPGGVFGGQPTQVTVVQAPEMHRHFAKFRHQRHIWRADHKHRRSFASAAEPGTAHCVRLCDGRHFQLADVTTEEATTLCSAACPKVSTKIFFGDTEIKDAVASDGQKYSDLPNAFVYLERIVPDCSCRDGQLGMAVVDVDKDPTLQRGDVVINSVGSGRFSGEEAATGGFEPGDEL